MFCIGCAELDTRYMSQSATREVECYLLGLDYISMFEFEISRDMLGFSITI